MCVHRTVYQHFVKIDVFVQYFNYDQIQFEKLVHKQLQREIEKLSWKLCLTFMIRLQCREILLSRKSDSFLCEGYVFSLFASRRPSARSKSRQRLSCTCKMQFALIASLNTYLHAMIYSSCFAQILYKKTYLLIQLI